MNDEKKEIKLRASTLILSIMIIVLVIILAIVLHNNTNYNIANNLNLSTNTDVSGADIAAPTTPPSKVVELDINNPIVKKLYDWIPAFSSAKVQKNAYQLNKVTQNDLSEEYLLANAFKNLEITESMKEPVMDVDGKTPMSNWYKFKPSILQVKVKEMYGKYIDNKSFDIDYIESLVYENEMYMYTNGGGTNEDQQNIRGIIKAYEKDGNLYIEDNYICYINIGDNASFYPSSDTSKQLDDYTKNMVMSKYKHTFKKIDGNYYWYSTEPIK